MTKHEKFKRDFNEFVENLEKPEFYLTIIVTNFFVQGVRIYQEAYGCTLEEARKGFENHLGTTAEAWVARLVDVGLAAEAKKAGSVTKSFDRTMFN